MDLKLLKQDNPPNAVINTQSEYSECF